MDPTLSFKDALRAHLNRMEKRDASEHRNEIWTVELFREADVSSAHATHSRDLLIEFERISHEVRLTVHEIEGLLPVIVWIWDNAKNRENLLARLSLVEEKIRSQHHHHERQAQFFELYMKNREGGLSLFTSALRQLLRLFDQNAGWKENPGEALRSIHDAQDGAVITGLFLEAISEAVTHLKMIDSEDAQKLSLAGRHLNTLAQKLHLKEEWLRRLVTTHQGAQTTSSGS